MISFSKAEHLLWAGLLVTTLATALVQLVIIGLIGIGLAPVALTLLFLGGLYSNDVTVSRPRAFAGFILFLAGIIALGYSAARASSIGYSTAIHILRPGLPPPSVLDWILLLVWCGISAFVICAGFALRTRWERSRLILWAAVIFSVPILGLAVFLAFAQVWPITA